MEWRAACGSREEGYKGRQPRWSRVRSGADGAAWHYLMGRPQQHMEPARGQASQRSLPLPPQLPPRLCPAANSVQLAQQPTRSLAHSPVLEVETSTTLQGRLLITMYAFLRTVPACWGLQHTRKHAQARKPAQAAGSGSSGQHPHPWGKPAWQPGSRAGRHAPAQWAEEMPLRPPARIPRPLAQNVPGTAQAAFEIAPQTH